MKAGIYPRCDPVTGYTSSDANALSYSGNWEIHVDPTNLAVENDVLILCICHHAGTWATVPDGWTLLRREVSGPVRGEAYWKRAAAIETICIISGINNGDAACILSYANCLDTGNPIDASTSRPNSPGTTGTAGITTNEDNALVLSIAAIDSVSDDVVANPTPSLSSSLISGGTLPGRTYQYCYTYTTLTGETGRSNIHPLSVSASHLLVLAPPASPPAGATGWNAYIDITGGTSNLVLQNSSPMDFSTSATEPTLGFGSTGRPAPLVNTTGAPFANWAAANIPIPLRKVNGFDVTRNIIGAAASILATAGASGATSWVNSPINNVGICVALKPYPLDPDLAVTETLTASTNVDAAHAYVIESLPFNLIMIIPDVAALQQFWFKYTPTSVQNVMGFFPWMNPCFYSIFGLEVSFYYGTDPGSLTAVATAGGGTENGATQMWTLPLLPDNDYYIKVSNALGSGSYSAANLHMMLHFYPQPADTIARGDLIVSDDSDPFPLVYLDQSDGHVKQMLNPFPAGETGAMLKNGFSLWSAPYSDKTHLYLYNPGMQTLTLVAGIVLANTNYPYMPQIRGEHLSKFYVAESHAGSSVVVYTVDPLGNVGAGTWTLPVTGTVYIGISRDENTLYYAASGESVLHRWDLYHNQALSDFPGVFPSGFHLRVATDILTLRDESLLFIVVNPGGTTEVVHFGSDGTLLNTYTIGTQRIDRIGLSWDDLTFWVRSYVF